MINTLHPTFGNDGTFWMSFEDFVKHFRALNVCKVNDWEELRLKGEFTCNFQRNGAYDNTVRSKFYYEVLVEKKQ